MTKTYAPHQLRVIDELAENNEKLAKLKAFLIPGGPAAKARITLGERQRLNAQVASMTTLSAILAARIADFDVPEDLMVLYARPMPPTDGDPLGRVGESGVKQIIATPLRRFDGTQVAANTLFWVNYRGDLEQILARTHDRGILFERLGAQPDTELEFR